MSLFTIFTGDQTSAVLSCAQGSPAFLNPKYLIMGVTYAPPGGSSSSVSYQNTSLLGNTSTIGSSFSSGFNETVDLTLAADSGQQVNDVFGFAQKAMISLSQSSGWTQSTMDSKTITINKQTTATIKTPGVPNVYSPVNHDYDIIWLWINPVTLFTTFEAFPSTILWSGYGYDYNDPLHDLDIIPVYVGYLNGDFGPLDAQTADAFSRSWVTNQVFAPGEGPQITVSDFASILQADPFAGNAADQNSGYEVQLDPTSAPGTTIDGRFTMAEQDNSVAQAIAYKQAPPNSTQGEQATYQDQYSTTTAETHQTKYDYNTSFGFDESLSLNVDFAMFTAAFTQKFTFTWENTNQLTLTSSNTQVDTAIITGPPCPSLTNPCNPQYTEPREFAIYQDNLYGTFMFWPNPFFSISQVSPSTTAVVAGGNTSFTLKTQANAGYTGTSISFILSGLPSGASYSSITGTPGNALSVPISTTSGTSAGTYPITIQATDGSQSYFAYATLVVTAAPPPIVSTVTLLSITPSGGSLSSGAPYTLTATVTPVSGSITPGGSVLFTLGTTTQAVSLNASGVATVSGSAPTTTGSLVLSAAYQGSTGFSGSTSTALTETITTAPPAIATSTSLAISPSGGTLNTGTAYSLTAIVIPASGSASPTGSILFTVGGLTQAAPLNASGIATFSGTSPAMAGALTISAAYQGSAAFAGSISSVLTETVVAPPTIVATTTQLYPAPSNGMLLAGSAYTVTAIVTPGSGSTVPGGNVVFTIGSVTQTVALNSSGSATLTATAPLSAGTLSLSASYSGTTTFSSSISGTILETITASPPIASTTALSIMPSGGTLVAGSQYTVTAAVSAASGSAISGGNVLFSVGTLAQTVPLNASGVATLTATAPTSPGTLSVQAVYQGSTAFSASPSSTVVETIVVPLVPMFTLTGVALMVSPGETTGNTSTIILTPSGGFTGSVTLSAAISTAPTGAEALPTLSFGSTSPLNVIGASPVAATLTVSTKARNIAALTRSRRTGRMLYFPTGVSVALLFLGCVRRRRYRFMTNLLSAAFLIFIALHISGCGSGTQTAPAGTTAGTYTITVTGTSAGNAATGTVALTVE